MKKIIFRILFSQVVWGFSTDGNQIQGLAIDYPSLTMHGIVTHDPKYPEEHLVVVVQKSDDDEQSDDDERSASPVEYDSIRTVNYRFVMATSEDLKVAYQTIAECQALHPDPLEEAVEDDEVGSGKKIKFNSNHVLLFSKISIMATKTKKNNNIQMEMEITKMMIHMVTMLISHHSIAVHEVHRLAAIVVVTILIKVKTIMKMKPTIKTKKWIHRSSLSSSFFSTTNPGQAIEISDKLSIFLVVLSGYIIY